MDPYLENPRSWRGVQTAFLIYLSDYLKPTIGPRYIPAVEGWNYVPGEIDPVDIVCGPADSNPPRLFAPQGGASLEPDESEVIQIIEDRVTEVYLNILDRESAQEVVTTIELVSHANKNTERGRNAYVKRQERILASGAHLVEIDLVRAGQYVLSVPEWAVRKRGPYDYLVSINRAGPFRDLFELYRRSVRDRLPRIRVPLAEGDPDVVADLQAVLEQTYEAGRYRDRLRYDQPCVPPLSSEDQAWANELIRSANGVT